MQAKYIIVPEDQRSDWFSKLSKLRMRCYRVFPYLYDGTIEIEQDYFSQFLNDTRALLVIIQNEKDELLGYCTGISLESEMSIISDLDRCSLNPRETLYITDVIIDPKVQGRGLGTCVLLEIETHAKQMGYKSFIFLTVHRSENHLLKPKSYISPDKTWTNAGYMKTQHRIEYEWLTFVAPGLSEATSNTMELWVKQ